MPSNNIAFARNYTSVIDEVYQRASVSGCLNSGRRMVRAGHNAKEILISKISVTGLGDYTRNVSYKTGAITYEFETKTFNYNRGIRPGRAGRAPRGHQRHGREAGDARGPLPLHHDGSRGRARRLLLREPDALQPRARALQPHRGGAAGALLHGDRPAFQRRLTGFHGRKIPKGALFSMEEWCAEKIDTPLLACGNVVFLGRS